jgi:hypothetical protein
MSEYQYYEFLAIVRPLSSSEMAALRRLSTRAEITSTRFQNEYHWGDFKGSPDTLMEKHFDAQANRRIPRQPRKTHGSYEAIGQGWVEIGDNLCSPLREHPYPLKSPPQEGP